MCSLCLLCLLAPSQNPGADPRRLAAADVITEPVDEVQRLLDEEGRMLHAIDLDGETYMRSEGGSLLVGVCKDLSERCFARTRVANPKGIAIADEQDCRPWAADGSPWYRKRMLYRTIKTLSKTKGFFRTGITARTSCSSRTSSGSRRS